MTEELFCRAKREDNREWTIGYLIQLDRTTYAICDAEEFRKTPEREKLQNPWAVIKKCSHKIDQSTICRRVRKLHSGETLFEFDWIIDAMHIDDAAEVKYCKGKGTFVTERIGEGSPRLWETFSWWDDRSMVIVGNRFDHDEGMKN